MIALPTHSEGVYRVPANSPKTVMDVSEGFGINVLAEPNFWDLFQYILFGLIFFVVKNDNITGFIKCYIL